MNLQQLYYFKSIADEKSFLKASEKYYVSASNLSHAISELEKEFGVKLIIRDSKNCELTEYGKRFLRRAENAIKEIDSIRPDIEAYVNNENKIIRLGNGHAPNLSFVPRLIRRYYNYLGSEAIHFDLAESVSLQTQQDLLDRKIDVGFNQYMGSEHINAYYLYSEELMLYVPDNFYPDDITNVSLDELVGVPMVLFGNNSGTAKLINDMFSKISAVPNIVNICTSDYLLLETVASGGGITINAEIPEAAFYPVKAIQLDGGKWKRHYYMLWRNDIEQEPIVQSFINYVKTAYRID